MLKPAIVVIYALVVGGWWIRHLFISLLRPLDLWVDPVHEPSQSPKVSVVIAARNERDRIAECIASLCAQGPVLSEVIVVDDRSDDNTAEVVRAAAKQDPRIRIRRVDTLPNGWAGKAHACHVGGQAAREEWILFADADCRFLPGGIAGALAYSERRGIDLLSLWVRADHKSFWEHMLIPLCGALILYWFPPLRVNLPRSRLGYANGQFILVRREPYLEAGGHSCAREAVIEDIPLAAHAKRNGLRLRTALGPEVVAVRMYTCFSEVINGWTRIFIGALQSRWKLLASVWSLLGGSLLPSLAAPAALAAVVLYGWPESLFVRAVCVLVWLHFVAVYSVSHRVWGLCGCARRYLFLYPLSVLVVAGILVRAWWWMVCRRPIQWRGSLAGPAGN